MFMVQNKENTGYLPTALKCVFTREIYLQLNVNVEVLKIKGYTQLLQQILSWSLEGLSLPGRVVV